MRFISEETLPALTRAAMSHVGGIDARKCCKLRVNTPAILHHRDARRPAKRLCVDRLVADRTTPNSDVSAPRLETKLPSCEDAAHFVRAATVEVSLHQEIWTNRPSMRSIAVSIMQCQSLGD
jgi:hypothetical protein